MLRNCFHRPHAPVKYGQKMHVLNKLDLYLLAKRVSCDYYKSYISHVATDERKIKNREYQSSHACRIVW